MHAALRLHPIHRKRDTVTAAADELRDSRACVGEVQELQASVAVTAAPATVGAGGPRRRDSWRVQRPWKGCAITTRCTARRGRRRSCHATARARPSIGATTSTAAAIALLHVAGFTTAVLRSGRTALTATRWVVPDCRGGSANVSAATTRVGTRAMTVAGLHGSGALERPGTRLDARSWMHGTGEVRCQPSRQRTVSLGPPFAASSSTDPAPDNVPPCL